VNLKKEKILERLTKLERDIEEIRDVIKVLYYVNCHQTLTKTECKGLFLKKKADK